MARLASSRGSPQVRALAQGLADQQQRELGLMQGWLMLWGAGPSPQSVDMAWMRHAYAQSTRRDPAFDQLIEGCLQGRGMPGMASAQDMEDLSRMEAAGAVDQRFLVLMVRHHRTAVVMARFAALHADLPLVRDLARGMAQEQQRELGQMLAWLPSVELRLGDLIGRVGG
jgi:uncharacterized protein (DUF305 family)